MPRRTKLAYDRWVAFAWHGVQVTVPDEWNPGRITGDAASGEVRLDDSELSRLEIEWKAARGDAGVSGIVDRYVEGLAKAAQKENRPLQVTRPLDVPGLRLPELGDVECFRWESLFTVHTLAAHCPGADRLVFLRLICRPREEAADLAARVFGSLSVAPVSGSRRWALYGLDVVSPAGYSLENHELKSGHLRFEFASGKTLLQVDRVSLAAILLKDRTLDDWYRDFYRKCIRHLDFKSELVPGQDTVLRLEGRPKGHFRDLLQPLPFWNRRPRRHLSGRAWADWAENRILVVQASYRPGGPVPDLDAVVTRPSLPRAAATG